MSVDRKTPLPVLAVLAILACCPLFGAASSTGLSVSPSAPVLGSATTLTAIVTPPSATGSVTFYSGVNFLGTAPLSSGVAHYTTKILPAGKNALRAYYPGNSSLTASTSSTIAVTVKTLPIKGVIGPDVLSASTAQAFGIGSATADFNGDGITDLVVSSGAGVSVFLGNANGTFQSPFEVAAPVGTASGVVALDFNGDGKADIAVVGSDLEVTTTGTVSVLLSNGNGSFQSAVNYTVHNIANYASLSLVAADFNGDGKADLIVPGGLSFLAGNGDGTFAAEVLTTYSTSIQTGVVTDVNGDGIPDIVGTSATQAEVGIYIGNGDGTFRVSNLDAYQLGGTSVAAADFDGDSKIDLVVTSSNGLFELKGDGDGTFQAPTQIGPEIGFVTTADFNDDGIVDIVYPGVNVYYGKGDGTFVPAVFPTGNYDSAIAVGDFNGDGRTDVASFGLSGANDTTPTLTIYYGRPGGSSPTTTSVAASPSQSTYGESVMLSATVTPSAATGLVTFYDGVVVLGTAMLANGSADLSMTLLTTGNHTLTARYLGDLTYAPSLSSSIPQTTQSQALSKFVLAGVITEPGIGLDSIAAADLNGDGKPDLIAGSPGGFLGAHVLMGLGNGAFLPPVDYANGQGAQHIAIGDLNMDGKLDFATTGVAVDVYFGKGDGTFTGPVTLTSTSRNGRGIAVADLNSDGVPDLIANTDFGFNVFLGNGDGAFTPANVFDLGYQGLTVADFNGDGIPDVFAEAIFPGLGTGTFGLPLTATSAFWVGDLNQDGKPDLISVSGYDLSITVNLGNGDGTFTALSPVPSTATAVMGVADFDGDGLPDLLLQGPAGLTLMKGNGDGTLQSPIVVNSQANNNEDFALADFKGDGRVDLALARNGTVTILLGEPASVNATTTTVTGSPNPTSATQISTLKATVTPSSATGTVTFYDGSKKLGTSAVTGGIATLGTSSLGSGARTLYAMYAGDSSNAPSFSPGAKLEVYSGGAPVLPPTTLPVAVLGQAYQFTLPVVGGTPPYSFSFGGGAPGLTLLYTGNYFGTPTAVGAFTLTTTVTDAAGLQASQGYQVVVQATAGGGPRYGGSVDSASCTGLVGWAADLGRLNTPINVSLFAGSTLIGSVLANGSRPDVGAVIGDNGLHGFSLPIPAAYANGRSYTFQLYYESSSVPLGAPVTLLCGANLPNYVGNVDVATCNGISGWAADTNRLNTAITVMLWDAGAQAPVATATANGSRPDVGSILGDNGLHGFTFYIPSDYQNGNLFTMQIRYENSTTQVTGSPIGVRCGQPFGPVYAGNVDTATCSGITGWAADRKRTDFPITVALWDPSTAATIASTTANSPRPDVGIILGDGGLHGFTLQIPASYADGAPHTLQVQYETSTNQLPGSPVTLTCGSSVAPPNYAGSVDLATCSGISGWVADRSRLNTAIVVSLWDPTTQTVIASMTANGSRADVGRVLGDNGLHGFTLQLPISYVDGTAHTLQVRYESSTTQVLGSPVTLTCGGSSGSSPNYTGNVDSATCSGISGWVADRNRLNTAIVVSLWDPTTQTVIASMTANGSRVDVGRAIGDNGLHGFTLQLPSSYVNGIAHVLQVRYESSTTQVMGSPVTLSCGGSSGTPNYVGFVDASSCSGIVGWAADRNQLNTPITVSLWDPVTGTVIASTTASVSRPDVGRALGDNGLHGFALTLPTSYDNAVSHTLQVRFAGSTQQLGLSPVTLTCGTSAAPNYAGNVDVLMCSTIAGWAANRNQLNTTISVNVYDGSTLLLTAVAGYDRPDVGTYLGDSGLHGFSILTPASVMDGRPHTITVRPVGSSTPLPGPQTLTCQ